MLLVDDDVPATDALRELLAGDGYDVRTAATGQEALRTVADFRPQVVVIDLGLPDINGLDLAGAVRAIPCARGARLVAMTGYQRGAIDAARAVGFATCLVKPVDLDALRAELDRAVSPPGP